MSYTKRLLILLGSFFTTFIFLSLMSTIVTPLFARFDYTMTTYVIYPLYSTLTFFFFVLLLSVLRIVVYGKILKENSIFLTIRADKITITDRLWYYIFIGLICFLPIIRGSSSGFINIVPIFLFLIIVLLVELILRFSIKRIKINFLRSGILVSGFDTRINIPMEGLGTQIRNDYGYYSYNDIESYYIFPDRVELFLITERGKIVLKVDNEQLRQLKGILAQQQIKVRKHL
ncbi:hypothetical protein [Sporosalibacterium faouarense]|uniref:hypothetical protein n=1 Tax=Sporosalibacterium faouarense TaxID=516123 RepID=UPI00141C894D|nr:hypothetical protein [Sporosalibacterium faouarense]MTI47325.1 hypothetical protein [Bacillota bacterium]